VWFDVLTLCAGLQLGACSEIVGAAEIRDELAHSGSKCGSIEHAGVVEPPGQDARIGRFLPEQRNRRDSPVATGPNEPACRPRLQREHDSPRPQFPDDSSARSRGPARVSTSAKDLRGSVKAKSVEAALTPGRA
jgi:hypothetical protein